jgi:hypothetical protein
VVCKEKNMPDGRPVRQNYLRRMDDSESPPVGQPFLIILQAIEVALVVMFVVFNASLKSVSLFPLSGHGNLQSRMFGGFPARL